MSTTASPSMKFTLFFMRTQVLYKQHQLKIGPVANSPDDGNETSGSIKDGEFD
jgi:hypothetical protein